MLTNLIADDDLSWKGRDQRGLDGNTGEGLGGHVCLLLSTDAVSVSCLRFWSQPSAHVDPHGHVKRCLLQ